MGNGAVKGDADEAVDDESGIGWEDVDDEIGIEWEDEVGHPQVLPKRITVPPIRTCQSLLTVGLLASSQPASQPTLALRIISNDPSIAESPVVSPDPSPDSDDGALFMKETKPRSIVETTDCQKMLKDELSVSMRQYMLLDRGLMPAKPNSKKPLTDIKLSSTAINFRTRPLMLNLDNKDREDWTSLCGSYRAW